MQYWNKRPEVRIRCWYKVRVSPVLGGLHNPKSVKRELWPRPGGRFFVTAEMGWLYIWFENKEDAFWFQLKWE